MKYHPILEKLRRSIKIKDTTVTELLELNDMSYENLDNIIKDIIKKIEYSSENYTALLIENEKLKKTIHTFKIKIENLEKKNNDNDKLEEQQQQKEDENNNISNFNTFKRVRRFNKASDGKYYIEGNIYNKLFGNRQEVWDGIAYHTLGELVKDDLIISNSANSIGKIVSKSKSRMEKNYPKNRFESNKS